MSEAGGVKPDLRPMLGEQPADLFGAQAAERMNEADAGIELRIAGQPLFDAWHSDQDQADLIAIEQIAQLLQARNLQPIGFVDQDQTDGCQRRPSRNDGRRRRSAAPAPPQDWRRKPISFQKEFPLALVLLASPRPGGGLVSAALRFLADAAAGLCKDA